VFIDCLGIGYQYSGVRDPATDRLPIKFHLVAQDVWMTVRPALPVLDDLRTAERLVAEGTAREIVLLFGNCWPGQHSGISRWRNADGVLGEDLHVSWKECLKCGGCSLLGADDPCPHCDKRVFITDSVDLRRAYAEATSISFDFRKDRI